MKGDKLDFEVSEASRWRSDVIELGRGRDGSVPRGSTPRAVGDLPPSSPSTEMCSGCCLWRGAPVLSCALLPWGLLTGARSGSALWPAIRDPLCFPPGSKVDEPAPKARPPAVGGRGGLRATEALMAQPRWGWTICLGQRQSTNPPSLTHLGLSHPGGARPCRSEQYTAGQLCVPRPRPWQSPRKRGLLRGRRAQALSQPPSPAHPALLPGSKSSKSRQEAQQQCLLPVHPKGNTAHEPLGQVCGQRPCTWGSLSGVLPQPGTGEVPGQVPCSQPARPAPLPAWGPGSH